MKIAPPPKKKLGAQNVQFLSENLHYAVFGRPLHADVEEFWKN